jgi:hypothetical protein
MSLPQFNRNGELPDGLYRARLHEILTRFGCGSPQRRRASENLLRVFETAYNSSFLERFFIFGSYVTAAPAPEDVDVLLVLRDSFRAADCDAQGASLFDHERAQKEFGASVFAIRAASIRFLTDEEFLANWGLKPDGKRRGIVELVWQQA